MSNVNILDRRNKVLKVGNKVTYFPYSGKPQECIVIGFGKKRIKIAVMPIASLEELKVGALEGKAYLEAHLERYPSKWLEKLINTTKKVLPSMLKAKTVEKYLILRGRGSFVTSANVIKS